MGRFDDITLEELQELREKTEGEILRERVLAAIGRKQGDQIDTLAERHGVVERTIIYWLDRFEEEPIERLLTMIHVQAVLRNLTMMNANSCSRLSSIHPLNSGANNRRGHPNCCSRTSKTSTMSNTARDTRAISLGKAGLSGRTARPRNHEADPKRGAEFQETVEKRPKLTEKTVVVVDQFTKRIGPVNRRGWYTIGSDPTIKDSNSWDKVPVLGAVTDDGDSFYCWTEENRETQYGIWLVEALKDRFVEGLVVFLDRAGYFYTRDLWEHVSGKRTTETVGSYGRNFCNLSALRNRSVQSAAKLIRSAC